MSATIALVKAMYALPGGGNDASWLETAFECTRDWDTGTAREARRAFDAAVCKAVQSASTFFRPPQALATRHAADQGRKTRARTLEKEAKEAVEAVERKLILLLGNSVR